MEHPTQRPRYRLPILITAVALLFFLAGWRLLQDFTEDTAQVLMPGQALLTISDPGEYTIFYESRTTFDGELLSTGDLPALTLEVSSMETGQPVEIEAVSATTSYSTGGRSGESVAKFTVDEAGEYVLSGVPSESQETEPVVLAVGAGAGRVFGAIGAIFAGAGSLLAAAVLAFISWRRRRHSRWETDPPVSRPAGPTEVSV